MGKKMKKKAPNPRKVIHRAPVSAPGSVDRKTGPLVVAHEGESSSSRCNHYSKSSNELNWILSSIRSSSDNLVACEHCREEPDNKRGKQPKNKGGARGSESKKGSNFIWVCLDCNRHFCGGEVSVLEPYGHARRHSKQEHHAWAVRSDDPLISWCYLCNSAFPIEMPPGNIDYTPKLATESENGVEPLALESIKGYVVRGLSNLGNTCFFNSVMQNILATDMLRDYLVSLDQPRGPMTMALKKLFVETGSVVDSKNVLSPKELFGSICAKAPQFRGYQQQDSHELLRYLLDGLHMEEIKARRSQDSSDEAEKADSKPVVTFVDSIFGGEISSTVCCKECGHTSRVHEPFLDLSLPVPSKKPPPKKVPPPPPKRSKPALKDKNKGRRFRETVVTKESSITQNTREDNSDVPSECSESVVPMEKPEEETVSVKVEDDMTWMDVLEAPATQWSCNEQDAVDPELDKCCKDSNMPSDSHGEASCVNEASSPCIQDSYVLLLPYKEPDQAVEDTARAASVDEIGFDGFFDLFNEPEEEVTSAPKAENGPAEELDVTLFNGNISESNHDEVDDSNAPVSISNCLALFTKPELLYDEQAWHCERCSENAGQSKGKPKAAELNAKSKEPLTLVEDSGNKEDAQSEGSSNFLGPDVMLKDEEIAAADDTSQYFSCQVSQENLFNQETDSCSPNDMDSVGCDQPSRVNLQLLEKGNSLDGNRSEEVGSETKKKVKRDAIKRILINRTPPVLTIHLKRFSQDVRGRLTKLRGHVSFQETLDLRPYMDPRSEEKDKCQYRLIGVVEHMGGMSGGHYIAYMRGERGGAKTNKGTGASWFYVSDAHVRESSLADVLNSDAYILFYQRV